MNYEDIKRHFESHPPPKEVEWTPWAKITDTQIFLRSCYTTIRNFNGPMDRCPVWWHLRDFYILMKNTQQSPAQAELKKGEPAYKQNASEENSAEQTNSEQSGEPTQADV